MADIIAEIRYVQEPEEDYPRVMRIKTYGKAGMLRLRECLERLARTKATAVDILSELPAVSQRVSHCVWHSVASPLQRSVTLKQLPDGHLSVDWCASRSMWTELLSVFDDYLAEMDKPVVDRSGAIVHAGPAIACLYPDPETDYDAVFEAEP